MENILQQLLVRLTAIGDEHEDVYDTDVREAMRDAVFAGFLKPAPDFEMPNDFKMYTKKGNELVRDAIEEYIAAANAKADELGLDFRGRYASFQNENVVVGPNKRSYDDFFGYTPVEEYDDKGNAL